MSAPAISVLLPVYNAAEFLPEALQSLSQQSFADFEIIAVDDGSTDHSKLVLQQFAATDPRLRLISRPNTGIVGALNDALAETRAPLLARMDADDRSHPERFSRQFAYMQQNPDCVALGTWTRMLWVTGEPIYDYPNPHQQPQLNNELLQGNGGAICHGSCFFRREALEKVGGYRPEALWFEDMDLYLRLLDSGELANLPVYLYDYRQHLNSVNQSAAAARQRSAHRLRLLNEHRQRHGLPPKETNADPAADTNAHKSNPDKSYHDPRASALRTWIGLAKSNGYPQTARKLARRLILLRPLQPRSWQFLRYAYS